MSSKKHSLDPGKLSVFSVLTLPFASLLRTRTGEQLDAWLEKVRASQIERDQQQVANRFQTWPTHLRTALGRKAKPTRLHTVVDIMRHRNSARHIEVVVVPAQEEIVAEVEVLFFAMAGDCVWKPRAQPAPELPAFLPW
ncbi:hypothetical protein [Ktedonobacter racemifer]|uniref:Uncharacterized protein n=1 Tax=Ktedonobacter racemifer DSM 44963 TaxID=485913 RepID=D6U2W9_KTERA|nr:hypothetical protein [Ktedonobacter racemifer]EFH82874.1 hypothetical protein Krac_3747 [Ktedonobacter racemifer DSM 44963]